MRRFRFRAGSLRGIPLWIHVSWFAVLVLVVWSVTLEFGEVLPGLPVAERLAMAAITGVAFFACLAVHEVAHAVVARRFGVRVKQHHAVPVRRRGRDRGRAAHAADAEFAVALAGPRPRSRSGSVVRARRRCGRAAGMGRCGGRVVRAGARESRRGRLQPGARTPAGRWPDPAGRDLAGNREPSSRATPCGGGGRRAGVRCASSRSASSRRSFGAARKGSGTCRWARSSGSCHGQPAGPCRRRRAVR